MSLYGQDPVVIGRHKFDLPEVMYYLYLPVMMLRSDIRLPPNVECCRKLIESAAYDAKRYTGNDYEYIYLSARKGWATPDNPLNRPGWHCDGFGSTDMNYVWWTGPGTRFAAQKFQDISDDHTVSLQQFEEQIIPERVFSPMEKHLYAINPYVVHATPLIGAPGCMRQYVKLSFSCEKYNLENNSHNYLFNYDWEMHSREVVRNDTSKAQSDHA